MPPSKEPACGVLRVEGRLEVGGHGAVEEAELAEPPRVLVAGAPVPSKPNQRATRVQGLWRPIQGRLLLCTPACPAQAFD